MDEEVKRAQAVEPQAEAYVLLHLCREMSPNYMTVVDSLLDKKNNVNWMTLVRDVLNHREAAETLHNSVNLQIDCMRSTKRYALYLAYAFSSK